MKNKINNKLLILTTIGAISMSGCASKTIEVIDTKVNKVTVPQVEQSEMKSIRVSKWKSLTKSKKKDCVNCYANIIKEPIQRVAIANSKTTVYGYDYSQSSTIANDNMNEVKLEEYENPYLAEAEDNNNYLVDKSYNEANNNQKNFYSKIKKSSHREENRGLMAKNSIQVGAFRKYAGAKVYAKRYSLLASKYNVDIKENVKNSQPIYRVQIEGFSNKREAKEFMNRYGLSGAFLVRR